MDAELMQLMARFKLRMRRVLDQTVDTYRFVEDRAYAMSMLRRADDSDDEDLIMLSLRLSDQLGWLPETPGTSRKADPVEPEAPKRRYMYGARG